MKSKYIFSAFLALGLLVKTNAQESSNVTSGKWNLNIGTTLFDFNRPVTGNFKGLKDNLVIGPDITVTRNFVKSGFGISGNVLMPFIYKNSDLNINRYYLMFGPGLVYNLQNNYLIPAKSFIAPYLFANALASVAEVPSENNDIKMGFGVPVGVGINWKLADGIALNTKGGYMFGITDFFEKNIMLSAGLTFNLSNSEKIEEPTLFIPVDTDEDGIPDESDECPEIAGLPQFNGCPDTDEDGIPDHKDECPEVAGLPQFNGCPDTDGDGIPDHKDDCPNVAGPASNKGCPEPDTDGDGVPDSKDRCPEVAGLPQFNGCPDTDGDGIADIDDECPEVPGPASNKGCPEINKEIRVEFETGKSVLKPVSYSVLDKVVEILKSNDSFKVNVEGHTDNTGTDQINEGLSVQRAKVCADYIISKGIAADRVSSEGFGSQKPIADNGTDEGRARNRRTDFRLIFK